MNKSQLIEAVSLKTGLNKAQTEKALSETFSIIKKNVKRGDDVKLIGFGTFTKTKRKARTGRNPQTGKTIKIAATWGPKFRPGSEFKKMVKL